MIQRPKEVLGLIQWKAGSNMVRVVTWQLVIRTGQKKTEGRDKVNSLV